MKLLVDSGNCKNIGDNAMLFNVLENLADLTNWSFFVIEKNVDVSLGKASTRTTFVKNNNHLLKIINWRISCGARQPILAVFWVLFLMKAIQLHIDLVIYKRIGMHITFNKTIQYWSKLINDMDAYWVVGGGNINDMGLGPVACKMLFAWFFRFLGKPVIFSGQTIGPLNRMAGKILVSRGIKNISLLSLREKQSFYLIKRLAKNFNNAFVTADDALTLINPGGKMEAPLKTIALNIRLGFYATQSELFAKKFSLLVAKLIDKYPDYKFLFIPIAFGKDDSDIKSAEKIIKLLNRCDEKVSIYNQPISIDNIRSLTGSAALAIGVSYHFCLFSLINGVPTIGLYGEDFYRQKLTGLMEMFENEQTCFDLRNVDIDTLVEEISSRFRDFPKDRINIKTKAMEAEWYEFLQKGISLINTRNKALEAQET